MAKNKKKTNLIKKLVNTIASYYVPDENGCVNRPMQVICNACLLAPLIIIEAVKVGIYDAFAPHSLSGFGILAKGLSTPLITVVKMQQTAAFGQRLHGFAPQYLLVMMAVFISATLLLYVDADRNKDRSAKKDGDMEFVPIKKYNEELAYPVGEPGFEEPNEDELDSNNPGNMIISKHARYSLAGTPYIYSCAFVMGPTGSGKSFRYVKPNILQMNSSYVVTDPKCELISSLGTCLMEHGYDVRLFNLKKGEQKFSCRYNPFNYIHDEQDVILTVDAFLDATTGEGGGGGDPFFPIAEKNFYYALFYYVFTQLPPEKRTLKAVYELYASADESDKPISKGKKGEAQQATSAESEFDKKFKEVAKNDPTNPCLSFYKTFKNGSPKTKQSILISVGVKLWFLSVPETANLLSGDDLNFEMMGDRKMALFVAIPTDSDSFKCLSAMMFTQLFQTLYYVGETVNSNSFLLTKGTCVAARSNQFIMGTKSEETERKKLEYIQSVYKNAVILDDNDLRLSDKDLDNKLKAVDSDGFVIIPKIRLAVPYNDEYKNLIKTDDVINKKEVDNYDRFKLSEDEKYVILEEFKSRKAAEIVLDAAINGQIKKGTKSHINRIRFILDEFFAIGKIAGYDAKIATFRSLKISTDIILQGKTQLAEMYDDKDGKILGNCDLKICLGAAEYDDAKYFSDICGQTTVRSESLNLDHKNGIVATSNGGSLSDNAQMLVRPEYLLGKMKGDECLVFTRTQGPFRDKKYAATEHPRWGETYDDHNPNTFDREFPYRKMFFIKQEASNLIRTVLVDNNVAKIDKAAEFDPAIALMNDVENNSQNRGKPIVYSKPGIKRSSAARHFATHVKNKKAEEMHGKNKEEFKKEIVNQYSEDLNNDGTIKTDAVSDSIKERLSNALRNNTGEYKYDEKNNLVMTAEEEFLDDLVTKTANIN